MNKAIGYILAALGIMAISSSFEPVQKALGIQLPSETSNLIIMGVGAVFVILGVIFMGKGSSSKQEPEVPIYQGNKIVGYRRVK